MARRAGAGRGVCARGSSRPAGKRRGPLTSAEARPQAQRPARSRCWAAPDPTLPRPPAGPPASATTRVTLDSSNVTYMTRIIGSAPAAGTNYGEAGQEHGVLFDGGLTGPFGSGPGVGVSGRRGPRSQNVSRTAVAATAPTARCGSGGSTASAAAGTGSGLAAKAVEAAAAAAWPGGEGSGGH